MKWKSGHAQTGAFAVGLLYLIQKTTSMFMVACFVIILYQRWRTKKHNIFQLLIGSLVGFIFAGFAYYGTKNYLYTKVTLHDNIYIVYANPSQSKS